MRCMWDCFGLSDIASFRPFMLSRVGHVLLHRSLQLVAEAPALIRDRFEANLRDRTQAARYISSC